MFSTTWVGFGLFLAIIGWVSCTGRNSAPPLLEVNLHSGIKNLGNVGDPETEFLKNKKWTADRIELGKEVDGVQFSYALHFREIGTRIYFRRDRVALIEIQEPFQGTIQGQRNFKLFTFGPPPEKTWEAILLKEFGPPQTKASGGRFGAEALFYPWGDISYNNNGANELAIYRDPEISRFRQKNFGRDISFFSR